MTTSHPKKGCRFKCLKSFKDLEYNREYIVIGFGSSFHNNERVGYQIVKSLGDNGKVINIKNTTLQWLTENRVIK